MYLLNSQAPTHVLELCREKAISLSLPLTLIMYVYLSFYLSTHTRTHTNKTPAVQGIFRKTLPGRSHARAEQTERPAASENRWFAGIYMEEVCYCHCCYWGLHIVCWHYWQRERFMFHNFPTPYCSSPSLCISVSLTVFLNVSVSSRQQRLRKFEMVVRTVRTFL